MARNRYNLAAVSSLARTRQVVEETDTAAEMKEEIRDLNRRCIELGKKAKEARDMSLLTDKAFYARLADLKQMVKDGESEIKARYAVAA